ncbi:hypothetical protein HYR99_25085 [Candidatus Poribacteria bacterium]|nr:hypothetical protein [Candidatus Poribacteria bacterium]
MRIGFQKGLAVILTLGLLTVALPTLRGKSTSRSPFIPRCSARGGE